MEPETTNPIFKFIKLFTIIAFILVIGLLAVAIGFAIKETSDSGDSDQTENLNPETIIQTEEDEITVDHLNQEIQMLEEDSNEFENEIQKLEEL